jgi:hypothetical protein
MCAVLYRRTAMAIKMANKVGQFFHCFFVCFSPGSQWSATEHVVARWCCSVASRVALGMLHQAMLSVLLWRTAVALEMAHGGGAFVFCHHLFFIAIIVAKDNVIVH